MTIKLLRPGFTNRVNYNYPGYYDWTCPEGIYWIKLTLIGSGSGGDSNGSGAAGGFFQGLVPTIPLTIYTLFVGTPTAGLNNNLPFSYITIDSTFSIKNSTNLITCTGGQPGFLAHGGGGVTYDSSIKASIAVTGGDGQPFQEPYGIYAGGGIGGGRGVYSGAGFFSSSGQNYINPNSTRRATGGGGGIGINGGSAYLSSDGTTVYSGWGPGVFGPGVSYPSNNLGGIDCDGNQVAINTDAIIGKGGGGAGVSGSTAAIAGKKGSYYQPLSPSSISGLSIYAQLFYEIFGILGGTSSGSYALTGTSANGQDSFCGGGGGASGFGATQASGGNAIICGGGGNGYGSFLSTNPLANKGGNGAGGCGGGMAGDTSGIYGNGGIGLGIIEW